jgi:UDP-N-acetylglucosamine 2-epimerase
LLISGTSEEGIYTTVKRILSDKKTYEKMSEKSKIYGLGDASVKISDIITKILNL